jgi:hypothetical protein
MSGCPLAQLTNNLKLLKKFNESGMVVIPLTDRIRFFETLAFMTRDSQRVPYPAPTAPPRLIRKRRKPSERTSLKQLNNDRNRIHDSEQSRECSRRAEDHSRHNARLRRDR